MWIYSQSTGELKHDGAHIGWGYSGWGAGKNDPKLQQVPDIGPIPEGFYTIWPITGDYEGKKAPVLRLAPAEGCNTFSRCGFLIHGDSIEEPGTASRGCIIMAHDVRQQVAASEDKDLQVTT